MIKNYIISSSLINLDQVYLTLDFLILEIYNSCLSLFIELSIAFERSLAVLLKTSPLLSLCIISFKPSTLETIKGVS